MTESRAASWEEDQTSTALDPLAAGVIAPEARLAISTAVEMLPNPYQDGPTDVFISYKRRLRPHILQFVNLLRMFKINVSFDEEFEGGTAYTSEVAREVRNAKCIVVFWTADCFPLGGDTSGFVIAEAKIGHERGVLVPVLAEPVSLDPPWNVVQTGNMIAWFGKDDPTPEDAQNWLDVLTAVGAKINRPALASYARASARNTIKDLEHWAAAHPDDPLVETARARARALRVRQIVTHAAAQPVPNDGSAGRASRRPRRVARSARRSVAGAVASILRVTLGAAVLAAATVAAVWFVSPGFRNDAESFFAYTGLAK